MLCNAMTTRPTEQHLQSIAGIDTWADTRIIDAMIEGQARAIAAVRDAAPAIAEAATLLAARLRAGGRLIYAGAGASMHIAVQDGSELPPTFGLDESRITYLVAGGRAAMFDNLAEAEDDADAARRDARACTADDTLIAVAASGSTPYTLAAARTAKAKGTSIIAIVNNPGTPLEALADVAIVLNSGPEVIVGSTRMAAGTAQKAALNLLSTLANIKLGAVHDGYMVNVQAGNAKLRARALGIVVAISGADEGQASAALKAANGAIKPAILLCKGAASPAAAQDLLNSAGNNLRQALSSLATTS
jgi:N-acetylmuramic acid 6-phosphate etherase